MTFRACLQAHQAALDRLDVPALNLIEETNRALTAQLGAFDITAPQVDIDALRAELLDLRRNDRLPSRKQLRYAGWAAMSALSRDYGEGLLSWVLDLASRQQRARPLVEIYGAYLHSGFGHPVADRLVPPALTAWLAKAETPRVRTLRARASAWGTLSPDAPGRTFATRLHEHAIQPEQAWAEAGIGDFLRSGAFAKSARIASLAQLQARLARKPEQVTVAELERITSILDG